MGGTMTSPVTLDGFPLLPGAGLLLNPYSPHWFVDGNYGVDRTDGGRSATRPLKTMDKLFDIWAGSDAGRERAAGSVVWCKGNIAEHLVTPTGVPDVTIIGCGTNPRHPDTHPLNCERSSFIWKSAGTASALLTVRNPGWRFINVLWQAHASHPAILMERNAIEDATEQDASHMSVFGCRFASGGYGIRDTGGCFNVRVERCNFQAVTEAILGVGNIGQGQTNWDIIGNRFYEMTNGVKIAAFGCRVIGNVFSDGGTPNTTYVLNLSNGGGGGNWIFDNFFQGTTANFNTPDVVGNATDVWMRNYGLDTTAAGTGSSFEAGNPA